MRDYIEIGSTPCEENCQQVPYQDHELAMREVRQFIEAIRKVVGVEPPGAHLRVRANPHDFGTYHEVVCYYDTNNEAAAEYAFDCENKAPRTWEEAGMVAPVSKPINESLILGTAAYHAAQVQSWVAADGLSHDD